MDEMETRLAWQYKNSTIHYNLVFADFCMEVVYISNFTIK